ncbi:MAG: hypothetical protein ACOXZ4_03935 [Sphaerochaetaceae bacterium]
MNRKSSPLLKVINVAFLIGVLALFGSCAVFQGLQLTATSQGWATTDLYVYDFFLTLLEDFEPFSETERTVSIMDEHVDDVMRQLHASPSATHISLVKNSKNSYFIDFTFSSLVNLLNDLNRNQQQNIIRVKGNSLHFYLDIDNYPQLENMVPFLQDPNFETFGPLYNIGMSEEEYLDMISYILGEEGPPSIESSIIALNFTTPSPITSYSGGEKTGANSIRFDIPLIDFLLLATPIEFSLSW